MQEGAEAVWEEPGRDWLHLEQSMVGFVGTYWRRMERACLAQHVLRTKRGLVVGKVELVASVAVVHGTVSLGGMVGNSFPWACGLDMVSMAAEVLGNAEDTDIDSPGNKVFGAVDAMMARKQHCVPAVHLPEESPVVPVVA